eukprot:g17092.t1
MGLAWLAALSFLVAAQAYRVLTEELATSDAQAAGPPSEEEQKQDERPGWGAPGAEHRCGTADGQRGPRKIRTSFPPRSARHLFGLELAIVGGRSGWWRCQCYRLKSSGFDVLEPVIDRYSAKSFDTANTWSGNDTVGWDSDFVCVKRPDGTLLTMTKEEYEAAGSTKLGLHSRQHLQHLHCGKCAACSAVKDLEVLVTTRKWITEVMTKVAARFAAPWGHHDPQKLREDLVEAQIDFSQTRYDGRDLAGGEVVSSLSDAAVGHGAAVEITGRVPWYDLNAQCLRCDELNCGPAFIKGAGANRRSAGIESDISRPEKQKCQLGLCRGVPEKDLPTLPKPSI